MSRRATRRMPFPPDMGAIMNPFMFLAGVLMIGACFWALIHEHWLMSITYVAFATADFALAMVRA